MSKQQPVSQNPATLQQPVAHTSACCSSEKQSSCCAPAAKSTCCGAGASASSGGCGCQ